ncbi:MAG: lysophospholipid acyltransferase family protein [Bacteriovoracaceae bacterium]
MIHRFLQFLIWAIIRLLLSTYRITVQGIEFRERARTIHPQKSFIFAVWHEQVVSVMSGHAWTEPYLALSSRSKDGDYAAYVSKKMGFVAVRGSSKKKNIDKGGKEAIREYVEKLNLGISGGLTVDGPKGPRQVCKIGVVLMSQETGAPILPVVGIASSYWEFNSWDRFKIPKPFSKILMVYGEPILTPKNASAEDLEKVREQVTNSLKELTLKNS